MPTLTSEIQDQAHADAAELGAGQPDGVPEGAPTSGEAGTRARTLLSSLGRDDRGLSTAEYAVGTCAVAGLGGLLVKLLTSDGMRDLIWSLLSKALGGLFGF